MNTPLLDQFPSEECTPHVRELLRAAIDVARPGIGSASKRFEFNRFEITLDGENELVVLEDVLDPADSGVQHLPMTEFAAALETSKGNEGGTR